VGKSGPQCQDWKKPKKNRKKKDFGWFDYTAPSKHVPAQAGERKATGLIH